MQNEISQQLHELKVSLDNLSVDLEDHIKTEEEQRNAIHKDVQDLKNILEQLRGAYKLIVWIGGTIAAIGAVWTWISNHLTVTIK